MCIERGSTWKRWDFHVHTPYSILYNEFGFDPDPEWENDVPEFDKYVVALFTKAVEHEIAAIGITDYFSIDGYKRIRQAYLDVPEKMSELFPDDDLRSRIGRIYVFPNIEFRIPTFVGERANSVNYHVIFSDSVHIRDIERVFLNQIALKFDMNETLPLCRDSIERIGADYKRNNRAVGSDYRVGLDHVTVKEDHVLELLKNGLFKDNHIVSIPVDEYLSHGVSWRSRDSITRKLLCQQSHCFMTSNDSTREWALGRDGVEAQINEFGSLKPCIWGSDAHGYDKMFCPDENRFCWIKAEPTFEGLKQILYEPADRVRIQKTKPEEKDRHQLIDCIQFDDDDFPSTPIYFSEGLNCIIGGKSTGKSILLRHIAKSIDPKIVSKRDRDVGLAKALDVCATVTWRDGGSDERKIVYIPQSWLSRTVDERGGSSEINNLIQDVLLQDESINRAYDELVKESETIIEATRHDILSYVAAMDKVTEQEQLLKAEGRAKSFTKTIDDLERSRKSLTEIVGVTPHDIARYGELEKEEIAIKWRLARLEEEQRKVAGLGQPFVHIAGCVDDIPEDGQSGVNYRFGEFPTVGKLLESAVAEMNEAIRPAWNKVLEDVRTQLSTAYENEEKSKSENELKLAPLRKQIATNEDLKKIEEQLSKERERQELAQHRERVRDELLVRANAYREKILDSRQSLQEIYERFGAAVLGTNQLGTDLEFDVQVGVRLHDLLESIAGIFTVRSIKAFQKKHGVDFSDEDAFELADDLFDKLFSGIEDGSVGFKGGFTAQTALEQLFGDWFYVHYLVKSEGDTIDTMSPGKKALVLLELIVNLEKGQCPILIDQPEDDLDNRSIYTELVAYLRKTKRDRQIIVVTHNANVVVGADAEEVIIANQAGVEAENYCRRFEYRCGPIENVSPVKEKDGEIRKGILNQKGIQAQICDILEGGKDAFEKRASKYSNIKLRYQS